MKNLISAMLQLYPEQVPADVSCIPSPCVICYKTLYWQVEQRGREVANAFQKERFATKRELNNLSRLTADASQIFPPDFVSCRPTDIAAQVSICCVRVCLVLHLSTEWYRLKCYLGKDNAVSVL